MNWPVPLLIVLMPSVADTAPLLRLLRDRPRPQPADSKAAPAVGGRAGVAGHALDRRRTQCDVRRTESLTAIRRLAGRRPGFLTSGNQPTAAFAVAGRAAPLAALNVNGSVSGSLEALAWLAALRIPFTEAEALSHLQGSLSAAEVQAVLTRALERQNPGAVSCAHHGADAATDLVGSRRQRSTRLRQRIAAGRLRRNLWTSTSGRGCARRWPTKLRAWEEMLLLWQSAPEMGLGKIALNTLGPAAQPGCPVKSYHLIIEAGHLQALWLVGAASHDPGDRAPALACALKACPGWSRPGWGRSPATAAIIRWGSACKTISRC